jgi:hypothetical protein
VRRVATPSVRDRNSHVRGRSIEAIERVRRRGGASATGAPSAE